MSLIKERPILFNTAMVRAVLSGRKTKKKLYPQNGESPDSPLHVARRLANGLDSAPDNGCWIWTRTARASGHATITLGGRTVSAYRLAYELGIGPIPQGQWVLHKCDNPRCIRPDHLELGDQKKNMMDCASRGRSARGARNGMAKLTKESIDRIRELHKLGWTQARLCLEFGVTQATVWRAVRCISWK